MKVRRQRPSLADGILRLRSRIIDTNKVDTVHLNLFEEMTTAGMRELKYIVDRRLRAKKD